MTKPVYIIARWKEWWTCAQSNKVVQNPTWTPIPIARDQRARRRLLLTPGGAEAYAALMLIVGVAATMPARGVLIDDSGAILDAFDLASLTGADASLFERALPLLLRAEIGYLERRSRSATGELVAFDEHATGLFAPPEAGHAPKAPEAAEGGCAPVAPNAVGARSQHAPSVVDDAGSQINEDEDERRETKKNEDESDAGFGPPPPVLAFVPAPPPEAAPPEVAPPPASCSSEPGEPGEPGDRARAADSSSCSSKTANPKAQAPRPGREPTEGQDTGRLARFQKFIAAVETIWAPRGTPQRRADHTDSPRLFGDFIWPQDARAPNDVDRRMTVALELVEHARRNGTCKMAWFKHEILYRLGRVGESPPARPAKRAGA